MKELIKEINKIDIKQISETDLENILPTLGMNGENLNEMPKHLSEYYGKGLHFWQYPNQFNKYLKQLSKYDINSYLEVGCRWGGTFVITSEILKSMKSSVKTAACDLIPMSGVLVEYANLSDFKYIQKSSFDLTREDVGGDMDLILIDGDHSYEGVKKDFEVCMQFNPKFVVFHDIVSDVCPGVVSFWNEIKNKYTSYEFIDQYADVSGNFLGIGLIEI